MKKIFLVFAIPSIIFCQNFDFNLYSNKCQNCESFSKTRIKLSSLWLSESPIMRLNSKNRIILQTGLASTMIKLEDGYLNYPNLDLGISVTNNLAMTIKIFGFNANNDSPQVIGAGLQYAYGPKDSLNWITAIQRVDLKALNHFRLSSITIDIRKYFIWKSIHYRAGFGSNFFKQYAYINESFIPQKMEGQINYFGIDALSYYSIFNIGIGAKIHPKKSIITVFVQKEIY